MRRWVDPLQTRAEGWTILVRLMVGLVVFFPEGIQKLSVPRDSRGGPRSLDISCAEDRPLRVLEHGP